MYITADLREWGLCHFGSGHSRFKSCSIKAARLYMAGLSSTWALTWQKHICTVKSAYETAAPPPIICMPLHRSASQLDDFKNNSLEVLMPAVHMFRKEIRVGSAVYPALVWAGIRFRATFCHQILSRFPLNYMEGGRFLSQRRPIHSYDKTEHCR